jgi:hypothetical protein
MLNLEKIQQTNIGKLIGKQKFGSPQQIAKTPISQNKKLY